MVPYSVPKDKLLVEITEAKKNFARAKIVSVITPSPFRQKPPCPFHCSQFTTQSLYCGGCNYQMIKYEEQLELKTAIVQDFFEPRPVRSGTSCYDTSNRVKVNKIIPAENPFGYRNKVQVPVGGRVGKVIMGFFQPQSHKIVDVTNCLLESKKANEMVEYIRNLINRFKIQPYDEDKRTGVLRHIIVRQSFAFNEFMIIFVTKTNFMPRLKEIVTETTKKFPEIVAIFQNINYEKTNIILGDKFFKVFGKDTIREKIGPAIFEISPSSFFQVNTYQAEKLYGIIKDFCRLKGGENIIDVYSGTGGIAIYLSSYCKKITGIEEVSSAVSDAIRNTKINKIRNVYFIRANADYALRKINPYECDIIILDPPRAGCSTEVINAVLSIKPKMIVYVSCNPATLSRDVKMLSKQYKTAEIQPVDMFPQTAHIECVVKLEKC